MRKKDQKAMTVIATGMLLAVLLLAGKDAVSVGGNAAGGNAAGKNAVDKNAVDKNAVDGNAAGKNAVDGNAAGKNAVGAGHKYRVVIDAGHGGIDPGKIGINDAQEKNINLQIALKVRDYLAMQDVEVIMTRENEDGLYDAAAENKKVQDMKRRIEIIDESAPTIAVSIHQNSYPEEYVKGAQVFYYTGSRQSEKLAESIQRSMVRRLDPENHRQVKANDSYYLLKKTAVPIVIVECGFLSNSTEAAKLCDAQYQDKTAWAVCMGIMQYLNGED